MDKSLVIQRFVPGRGSTTSDSQFGAGSSTAELYNLAAIIKNNMFVIESPAPLLAEPAGIPPEGDPEQGNG